MVVTAQYYICNNCRFRTALFSRIEEHLLEHNVTKEPPPFSYFDCSDHLKPLKCTSCHFSTDFWVLLRYHLVCNHDQQQFALQAKLWIRHHMYGTCKDKKESKEKKKQAKISIKNIGKWYLCEKCDYRTVRPRDLKNHVINKHTPLEDVDWQHCKKCAAKFKTLRGLKKHQKCHVSAVDHLQCPKCDYSTALRHNFVRHFNYKHARPEEIKWVECYHCGAKYKDKEGLKKHLVRHTTKEKQYKCDQCPYETHHKDNFKHHIIRHLTKSKKEKVKCKKSFKCEHCHYSAKCTRDLKNHVLVNHNMDGEVFQCKQCSYNSRSKIYLTNHIREMHRKTKFFCADCSFATKTNRLLKRHMFNKHTVHNEEEKLNCPHCSYFSFNKQFLTQHLKLKHKIGAKIRWYKCDKCDYKNQDERHLVSHMYKVHNDGKHLECDQCV